MSHERAFGGPVLLDIGDGVGALIVHLDFDRVGSELHLRPTDGGLPTHTGVWERDVAGGRTVAAVFPSLAEASYEVLGDDGAQVTTVQVKSGEVTELSLELDTPLRRPASH